MVFLCCRFELHWLSKKTTWMTSFSVTQEQLETENRGRRRERASESTWISWDNLISRFTGITIQGEELGVFFYRVYRQSSFQRCRLTLSAFNSTLKIEEAAPNHWCLTLPQESWWWNQNKRRRIPTGQSCWTWTRVDPEVSLTLALATFNRKVMGTLLCIPEHDNHNELISMGSIVELCQVKIPSGWEMPDNYIATEFV